MSGFWPQEWAFFADEPQDETAVVFRIGPAKSLSTATMLQFSRTTDCGLNRNELAQEIEIYSIILELRSSQWLDCDALSLKQCETASLKRSMLEAVNLARQPSICGHVLISEQRPLGHSSTWQVAEITNVYVRCAY